MHRSVYSKAMSSECLHGMSLLGLNESTTRFLSSQYELPGIFVMIAIVILLFIGFSCLADVNCPVSYEEKTLVLNKEF